MFQTKFVEKIKTHILRTITCFRQWCRLRDNVEKYCRRGRPHMTIGRMRIACWITKATDTHSEYVILFAFPLQRWLHERLAMRYSATILTMNRTKWCAKIVNCSVKGKRSWPILGSMSAFVWTQWGKHQKMPSKRSQSTSRDLMPGPPNTHSTDTFGTTVQWKGMRGEGNRI
jgi:hypothetical protein